jgi:dTDP-4-amino-4,6-dideoxygalactose transaminase
VGPCANASPLCAGSCPTSATSATHGLPESRCRDWLKQALQDAGVSTIIYYPIPIHRQPAYAHLGHGEGTFPVTERLCSEVLSLPIFPELTATQQDQVVKALENLLSHDPLVKNVTQDRMVA